MCEKVYKNKNLMCEKFATNIVSSEGPKAPKKTFRGL